MNDYPVIDRKLPPYAELSEVGRIITSETDFAVRFRDSGTGIAEENRKLIFTGFFHTRDTGRYSTKTPCAFNAAGAGADLLRAKVFPERRGFSIDFDSARCPFIPEDTGECPGRLSRCLHAGDGQEYRASGTVFALGIPVLLSVPPGGDP